MMLRPVQFGSAPRFGSAGEATDADVAKQLSAADQNLLMQLRLGQMKVEECRQANKEVANQVKTYDTITQTFGTAAVTTALGLMAASAFGGASWLLGGLLPFGLIAIPGTKKLIAASERLNSYFS